MLILLLPLLGLDGFLMWNLFNYFQDTLDSFYEPKLYDYVGTWFGFSIICLCSLCVIMLVLGFAERLNEDKDDKCA